MNMEEMKRKLDELNRLQRAKAYTLIAISAAVGGKDAPTATKYDIVVNAIDILAAIYRSEASARMAELIADELPSDLTEETTREFAKTMAGIGIALIAESNKSDEEAKKKSEHLQNIIELLKQK